MSSRLNGTLVTFFIKKLFTYEHMLNGKSKKYLI